MRLWHKDLIAVLPRQQLLGQWRECCLIAKNIAEKGTPNHILVNKVIDYPKNHFGLYAREVYQEMIKRGYKVNAVKLDKWLYDKCVPWVTEWQGEITHNKMFNDWHNERYLTQCFYNLQEKYDCGGISQEEWQLIFNHALINGVDINFI